MSVLSKAANAFARMSPFFKGLTIIGIGVLGLVLLMVLRPRPAAQEPPRRVPLVVTAPADVRSGNLTIRGNGSVRPKSQIVISSQVAGRVEWVSPAFSSGGRFDKGDLLLKQVSRPSLLPAKKVTKVGPNLYKVVIKTKVKSKKGGMAVRVSGTDKQGGTNTKVFIIRLFRFGLAVR